MIHLEKLVFNSFRVNTYLLHDETKECIIIDPANYDAAENKQLTDYIAQHNLKPVLNLNTHCHIDHVLGINYVREHYGIALHAHEQEKEMLQNAPLMGELFGFNVDPLPTIDKFVGHNETICFGNSALHAIHVPGHSRGSLAFYSKKNNFVITGDVLFENSIGRTDLQGGDFDTLIDSISNFLFTLPPGTSVWPGHGEPTTVEREIKHNPFFNDYKT
ncbi:MAG: MBL fold metallo-hydrolase [Bacteroidales bacterium]|nr:MBL fold metallo-hydrolase [Bacteroidales bacterium]